MIITVILYFVGGMVAGTAAGLLGIGGGLITVPFLAFLLPYEGVPHDLIMHMAVGTTLMITITTSISSIRAHWMQGGIKWPVFKQMSLGLFLGAVLGAIIADFLPSDVLRIFFGIFALMIAARMGLNVKTRGSHPLPGRVMLFLVAMLLSCICALLGLAGGALSVPFFARCRMRMENAVATSSVCTLPIAIGGGLSFLIAGLNEPGLPAWSTGYIFWPAFLGIASMSILFAPLGAKLAHRLPALTLKRVFAVFLLLVGIDMLLR